jgi:hypothetical protein
MVSIVAFQAVDPGSIPGHRINFFSFNKQNFLTKLKDDQLIDRSRAKSIFSQLRNFFLFE